MPELPPCGLYRTRKSLGDVPAGRLVYFHNHGNPGPGIYLPSRWQQNRAVFHESGIPLGDLEWANTLEKLPAEGFYRVEVPFTCCDQKCRTYEPGTLVQLGYDGNAEAILFTPEWTASGFTLPESGTRLDPSRLSKLEPLKVPGTQAGVDRVVH